MTPALPKERALLSHRLTEVPLRGDEDRLVGRHRILSTLTVAHGAGRPVVVAWVRGRPSGPVQVFVGGTENGPESDDAAVGFPPGAKGRTQSASEIETALSGLKWQRTQLTLDAGTTTEESLADRLEDLFTLTSAPMAFLAVARPVAPSTLSATIEKLSDEVGRLEALRTGRGVHRRQLARVEQNLEYFDRSVGVGCWELEVWTGGADDRGARVAAAMLAGSGDLAEVPLMLRPESDEVGDQHAWTGSVVAGADAVNLTQRTVSLK